MSEVGYFASVMLVIACIVLVAGDKIWAWLKSIMPWNRKAKFEAEMRAEAPDPENTGSLEILMADNEYAYPDHAVNYADIEGEPEPEQLEFFTELEPQRPSNWKPREYVGKHRPELQQATETLPVLASNPVVTTAIALPPPTADEAMQLVLARRLVAQSTQLELVQPTNQLTIPFPEPTLAEQVHDEFEKIKRDERREWDKLRRQIDNDLMNVVERVDYAVAEEMTHGQHLQSMFTERINRVNQYLEEAMRLVKEMQTA